MDTPTQHRNKTDCVSANDGIAKARANRGTSILGRMSYNRLHITMAPTLRLRNTPAGAFVMVRRYKPQPGEAPRYVLLDGVGKDWREADVR